MIFRMRNTVVRTVGIELGASGAVEKNGSRSDHRTPAGSDGSAYRAPLRSSSGSSTCQGTLEVRTYTVPGWNQTVREFYASFTGVCSAFFSSPLS